MSETFQPLKYQEPLNQDELILKQKPDEEAVPMDVLFVGGGPAGLAGAIELSQLIKKDNEAGGNLGDIEIGVLEKSSQLGEHCLSGAVINPCVFEELFPEKKIEDFPFRKKVTEDSTYLLTEEGRIPIPTPPTMHNKGNYVGSICEAVRWLGEQAEERGVNILPGFPVSSLLVENERVIGVRTTETGLNRDGSQSSSYMPATDLTAQVTVLTEGTRGPLGQAYRNWQNISSPNPQIYALGVKELWRVKKPLKKVIHTLGWPLPSDAFGGSWMYPMADDLISLGFVLGLDYKQSNLDTHLLLQKLKQHPLVKPYLAGGELLEWGAKTIPEGGHYSLPERMHGDGLIMAGDTVGFVNVPAIKGIHYAMKSGVLAAQTIFQALKSKDTSAATLKNYDEMIGKSFIQKDLFETRNMRLAFKDGFILGGAKAALMTASKGVLFGKKISIKEDAATFKKKEDSLETDYDANDSQVKILSKVDAVYQSGNKTRDDAPSHLITKENLPEDVVDMYVAMCPAGVYEKNEKDQLITNAPNCVDCKATDVLGPRWKSREGGSGPSYKQM